MIELNGERVLEQIAPGGVMNHNREASGTKAPSISGQVLNASPACVPATSAPR